MPNNSNRQSNQANDNFESLIAERLNRARAKLLDLTKRSPLLKFKYGTGVLRIVEEVPSIVFKKMVDEDFALQLDAVPEPKEKDFIRKDFKSETGEAAVEVVKPEAKEHAKELGINTEYDLPVGSSDATTARHNDSKLQTLYYAEDLDAVCGKLYKEYRTLIEEKGICSLYVCFGMLSYFEAESSNEPLKAPVVLLPVTIKRDEPKNGKFRFELAVDGGEPSLNFALAEKLKSDYNVVIPELNFDDTEFDLEKYFQTVRGMLSEIAPRWKIENEINVTVLKSASLVLYQDLSPQKWIGKISEGSLAASFLLGQVFQNNSTSDFVSDDSDLERKIPVITSADSSQKRVISGVLAGKSMVVQGPPGTGKSQTITNLIAALIKNRKKVLFVAEKEAALNVVKTRLEGLGLGKFLTELHGVKTNKSQFLEQVKTRIAGKFPKPKKLSENNEGLEVLRSGLNQYAELIGQVVDGESLQTRIGQAIKIRNEVEGAIPGLPEAVFSWKGAKINFEHFRSSIELLIEYAKIVQSETEKGWGSKNHPCALIGVSYENLKDAACAEDVFACAAQVLEGIQAFRTSLEVDGDQLGILLRNTLLLQKASELPLQLFEKEFQRTEIHALKELERLIREKNSCEDWFKEYNVLPLAHTGQTLSEFGLAADAVVRLVGTAKSIDFDAVHKLIIELHRLMSLRNDNPFEKVSEIDKQFAEQPIEIVTEKLEETRLKIAFGLEARLKFPMVFDVLPENEWRDTIQSIEAIKTFIADNVNVFDLKILFQDEIDYIRSNSSMLKDCTFFRKLFHGPTRRSIKWLKVVVKQDPRSLDLFRLAVLLDQFAKLRVKFELLTNGKVALENVEQLDLVKIVEARSSFEFSNKFMAPISVADRVSNLGSIVSYLKNVQNCWAEVCEQIGRQTLQLPIDHIWTQLDQLSEVSKFYEMRHFEEVRRGSGSFKLSDVNTLVGFSTMLVGTNEQIQKNSFFCKNVLCEAESKKAVQYAEDYLKLAWEVEKISEFAEIFKIRRVRLCLLNHMSELNAWISAVSRFVAVSASVKNRFSEMLKSPEKFFEIKKVCSEDIKIFLRQKELCLRISESPFAGVTAVVSDGCTDPVVIEKLCDAIHEVGVVNNILSSDRFLHSFNGSAHGERRKDYQKLDAEAIALMSQQIAHEAGSAEIPPGQKLKSKKDWTDLALLEHETSKERRHLPLRRIVAQATSALCSLTPCFMMSPGSIAQFLPDEFPEFDVLIIDEASQVTPEAALGAILRSKQVVIVGDPMQLPPTNFFGSSADDLPEHERLVSILDLASEVITEKRMLNWHYRSQHESLIAFSNRHFYGNKLVVFPSPILAREKMGILYYENPAWSYDGSGVNPKEAQAVVARVADLAKAGESSIGIVAMNAKQADLIEELLLEASKTSKELCHLLSEDSGLFVKNLENVQGDERDVIVISCTYGKQINPDGTESFFQRFGPINNEGGERRLNVLFSRSRCRMEIFSSIDVEKLELRNEGVKALASFLKFAKTGQLDSANEESGRAPDSPFEVEVIRLIESCGYEVTPQLGVAGYFIDIAVKAPGESHRYLLAVECDGAMYHSSKVARDRDRLREMNLRNLGWDVYRIWSTDWFRRPKEVSEALRRRLHELHPVNRIKAVV